MAKFAEADARLFKNIFVCRKCKNKVRAPNMKVLAGKVKCRTCNGKALRTVRKK
ncbi:50S ribosomal protein L40e [Candidatus Woesearchaeota archaeon]|nr:MAG: 50S ribosomal protein L40e [Candidatus Woesearchaeota archaeon]